MAADRRTLANKTTLSLSKSDGNISRVIYELSDKAIVRYNIASGEKEPTLDEIKRKARIIENYKRKKQSQQGEVGGKA